VGSGDLPLRLHLSLPSSFSQTPDLSLSDLLDFLSVSHGLSLSSHLLFFLKERTSKRKETEKKRRR